MKIGILAAVTAMVCGSIAFADTTDVGAPMNANTSVQESAPADTTRAPASKKHKGHKKSHKKSKKKKSHH